MIESQTATVTTPCDGLVQFSFPHHGCMLSVSFKEGSYATWVVGSRMGSGPKYFPLSYEIGVRGEDGELIQITSYDTVAPYQSLDMVQTILQKMERDGFNIKDLELFCD